jgi:hypothetical protein
VSSDLWLPCRAPLVFFYPCWVSPPVTTACETIPLPSRRPSTGAPLAHAGCHLLTPTPHRPREGGQCCKLNLPGETKIVPALSHSATQGEGAHAALSKSLLRCSSSLRFSYGDRNASSSARAAWWYSNTGLAAPNPVVSTAATSAVLRMSIALAHCSYRHKANALWDV